MSIKPKDRTLPERLYNANVLSDGALLDVSPAKVAIAKIEKHSSKDHSAFK